MISAKSKLPKSQQIQNVSAQILSKKLRLKIDIIISIPQSYETAIRGRSNNMIHFSDPLPPPCDIFQFLMTDF
jgi:hypothetical protein